MKMLRAPTGKTLAIGLLGLVVAGALFGACASGAQGPGSSDNGSGGASTTTSSSGTGGHHPIKPGQLGSPCTKPSDCQIGKCTDLGNGKYCSTECPPECPGELYCGLINGKGLCIPNKDQCDQCSDASPCGFASERCLTTPAGDSFCGVDCTSDGICPNGFECVDGNKYENGSGNPTGSGGAGGGGGAKGVGGAGGAGGAGGTAGGTSSTATKFCVPNDGASCPCDDKRDGVSRSCDVKNTHGSCSGSEICDSSKGKFVDCSAKTPKKESCNGKDDNCNDQVDEGDPNDLCSDKGPPPQNATWDCKNATCVLGKCDSGWAAYPAGQPSAGCQCKVEDNEPNDTCAQVTDAGSVTDTTGNTISLGGTLSSDTDVDVYTFNAIDGAESGTNSYHVKLVFELPAANNEFVMDVMRGATCSDAPTGPSTNITSYDWCVNGSAAGPIGLAPCGNVAGENECANVTSKYYVRVYRKAGATKTCSAYKITATAAGGACTFGATCP